jgi:hypothetical protein
MSRTHYFTLTLPSARGMSTAQAVVQELPGRPERVTKTSGTGGDGRSGKE